MADEQAPNGLYQGSPLQKTVDAIGSGLSTAGDYLFGDKGKIGGQLVPQSVIDEKQALMQRAGLTPESARVPATNAAPVQVAAPATYVSPEQLQQEIAAQPVQQPVAQIPQVPVASAMQPYTEMQKAEKAAAEAEAAKFGAQQQYEQNREEMLNAEIQKQRDQNNVFAEKYQQTLANLDTLRANMEKDDIMNAKVDRARLWNNLSTPQKILGGVAVFLGGFGAGLTGGQNKALDIITNAIEQDIAAQRANIENRRANVKMGIDAEQNALENLRTLFKDNEVAENALRALQLDKMESVLKQTAAKNDSKIIQQKANMAIQQIELKKQELNREIQAALKWQSKFSGAGKSDQPFAPEEIFATKDEEKRKMMADFNAKLVPGIGVALDEQAAKKARDVVGATTSMLDTLDEIMKVRAALNPVEIGGQIIYDSEKVEYLKSLSGQLLSAYKQAEDLGALDNGVKELVKQIAPNPAGINPNTLNTYKSLRVMQLKKSQDTLAPLVGLQNARKFKGPQPLTSAPIKKLGE